jgi:hypothetical protein
VADIVLDEEDVEVPGKVHRVLERVALAVSQLRDPDPGATKGSRENGDRRQVGSPVRFCWAALQSDAK